MSSEPKRTPGNLPRVIAMKKQLRPFASESESPSAPRARASGGAGSACLPIAALGTLAVLTALTVSACGQDGASAPAELSRGPLPELASVPASEVESGFAIGHLRRRQSVEGFRVMKHAVTRREVAACVAAGACPAGADALGCDWLAYEQLLPFRVESEDSPATCAPPAAAAAYCAWVGGRLPHLAEWQLAARGPSVARTPLGNTAPPPGWHPRAQRLALGDLTLVVGRQPAGASPYGVEDLLLVPGELVATEESAPFASCRPPAEACVVHGFSAGAIDAVEGPGLRGLDVIVHAFRCVVEE